MKEIEVDKKIAEIEKDIEDGDFTDWLPDWKNETIRFLFNQLKECRKELSKSKLPLFEWQYND